MPGYRKVARPHGDFWPITGSIPVEQKMFNVVAIMQKVSNKAR